MSTQVLQEFFVHAVHKLRLPPSQARSLVQVLSRRRTIQVNASLTLRAIDTSERYRISFWDGAIIEAAVEGGCMVLYTEACLTARAFEAFASTIPF